MAKRLFMGILIFCLLVSANTFAEDLKVGYLNLRKIFYEYNKTKKFNKELESNDESINERIQEKTKEIKKLRDELDLLSEEAQEKKHPELRKKLKELDDYKKEQFETFIRRKDEMFKEVRDDILVVAEAYAKKNGYDIIIDEAMLLYISEKHDITNDILKELNK